MAVAPTRADPRSADPSQPTALRTPGAPRAAPSSAGAAGAPPRLVAHHIAAATLYLVAGAVGLVWIAPDLARGMYLAPRVAGVTHLFTLGWLTLTIFGALGQILPMALGAPLRSVRMGRVALWLLAPGIGVFAAGVAASATPVLVAGVLLVASGILIATTNLGATLARGRNRDVTWAAIAIGLTFLVSTLVLGLVLAHNLHSGFVAAHRVRILTAHLHVAVVGWALVVVVGVSRRLLPMFLIAHSANARWSRRALALLAAGVPVLAVGLLASIRALAWIGTACLEAGMAAMLWQTVAFYRARTRPKLDVGMRFVAASLPFLAAAAVMGPVLLAVGASHTRLATAYVITGLLGGLVPFVTGFLYEIAPTLAWTARYAGRLNRGRVPVVADLYSAPIAMLQLTLTGSGVVLLLAGVAAAAPAAARAGSLLFLVAAILFAYQTARMRWGTPAASRSSPPVP